MDLPQRPTAKQVVAQAIARADQAVGLTVDELEQFLQLSHQTASARVHELEREGVVHAIGKRRTRAGGMAKAWALKVQP